MIFKTRIGEVLQISKRINFKAIRDEAILAGEELYLQKILEQWKKGENKDGQAVGYYTEFTEKVAADEFTIMPKVAGEPYNLLWSGALYNNIALTLDDENLIIDSAGSSEKKDLFYRIENINGYVESADTIFGLNEANFEEYQAFVYNYIRARIKEILD